jgi:hypothetical protein
MVPPVSTCLMALAMSCSAGSRSSSGVLLPGPVLPSILVLPEAAGPAPEVHSSTTGSEQGHVTISPTLSVEHGCHNRTPAAFSAFGSAAAVAKDHSNEPSSLYQSQQKIWGLLIYRRCRTCLSLQPAPILPPKMHVYIFRLSHPPGACTRQPNPNTAAALTSG